MADARPKLDFEPVQNKAGSYVHCVLASPRLCARDTACARLSTFNFAKMRFTCVFTVSGVMVRSRAISLLDSPLAISLSIVLSRALRSSAVAEEGVGPGAD